MSFKQGKKVETTVAKTKLHFIDSDRVKQFKPKGLQVLKGSQGTIIASEDVNGNLYVEFKNHLLILHKDCLAIIKEK